MISGANDYEVQAKDPTASTRDLDYEFIGMVAHAGIPLDVAVVDESDILQARARIILPPPVDDFPAERLVMKNGLTPGGQTLYFFADNDGDGSVDGTIRKIVEHIWIEPVPDDGKGQFMHDTNFDYFNEDDYRALNGALVLKMPESAAGADATAFLECLDGKLGKQLDVILTLIEQDRQVGLFRRYRGTAAPEEVRLNGILDGGSQYSIEVIVDGKTKKKFEKQAPTNDDLVVPASEWLPISLAEALACR